MGRKTFDPKTEALRAQGCLHPHPERVTDPLFADNEFFDARDLMQVKYEMLRRTQVDGEHVSASAAAFGFSRPSFYQAQAALARDGLRGLVPAKPGPRRAHKLSDEVVDFLEQKLASGEAERVGDLVALVKQRFGRQVHPRSVERALARREKKLRGRASP
jgi:transposase